MSTQPKPDIARGNCSYCDRSTWWPTPASVMGMPQIDSQRGMRCCVGPIVMKTANAIARKSEGIAYQYCHSAYVLLWSNSDDQFSGTGIRQNAQPAIVIATINGHRQRASRRIVALNRHAVVIDAISRNGRYHR